MLFHRLAKYRVMRKEPVEQDFPMQDLFAKWVAEEIKEVSFHHLYGRSWAQV